jgi:hypothetical protein
MRRASKRKEAIHHLHSDSSDDKDHDLSQITGLAGNHPLLEYFDFSYL